MTTLVILAGGLGSRYKGNKQLAALGPNNECLLEYSIYDAVRAGFQQIVVLSSTHFISLLKAKLAYLMDHIDLIFINQFEHDPAYPNHREIPLGTGHAIWSCRNVVNDNFMVVNADDYYGSDAFKMGFEFFKNRLLLGVNYFVEDYEYKFGATNPNVPQALNVHKWLLKGIYEYNKLDYFYQYVSGFKSQFVFQYVTSTSDMLPDFFIGWNDFFLFKRVGEKGNWANRIRLGISSNDETPFAPFSVDNNLNIRGVGNTIDRGTGAIVLNSEYRQTLIEKGWFVLQGNAFLDAGSWRNPGGELSDFSKDDNIKVYPGLGLRFIHKKIYNAIFRIDYGYGISQNATKGFVFGIGQYFKLNTNYLLL